LNVQPSGSRAAPRAATVERLRQNIALQRTAQGSSDLEQFYRLDEEFHRELVAASGYPGISELLDRSRAHLNRVRSSASQCRTYRRAIDQHSAVLQAWSATTSIKLKHRSGTIYEAFIGLVRCATRIPITSFRRTTGR